MAEFKYRKRTGRVTITAGGSAATTVISFGGVKYGKILGFRALLTGTDTAVKIKLTDSKSKVAYLDAADVDYKTAAVNRVIFTDDTTTGLSFTPTDATGAAVTAGNAIEGTPVLQGPISVTVSNGGTTGDYVDIELFCEV